MHVNQPTPLLRIVLWRILYISFTAAAIIAYLLLWSGSTLAEEIITTDILNLSSPIVKMLDEYGDRIYLPEGNTESYSAISRPIVLNIENVSITLREIIYDGVWLYTAADISCLSPESVIVMPGSANFEEPCYDLHNEQADTGNRSFKNTAIEDGKRLLAVYVYPKEFDEFGEYFLDHYQLTDGGWSVLSGAYMDTGNETTGVTWSIQIYDVDLFSGQYTLVSDLESNTQQVTPFVEIERQEYKNSKGNAPFDSVQLLKTGLTMYIQPMIGDKPYMIYDFMCLTLTGKQIAHGASPDIRALALDEFPDEFILNLYGEGSYHLIHIKQ